MTEQTYWNNNGKYQNEYEWLDAHLVPVSGMAETTNGEALRCVANIYYDAYNNGGCNFDIKRDQWNSLKRWLESHDLSPDIRHLDDAFYWAQDDDVGYPIGNMKDSNPLWLELERLTDMVILEILTDAVLDKIMEF